MQAATIVSVKEALKRAWVKDTGEAYAATQRVFLEHINEGIDMENKSVCIRSQRMGASCSDILSQLIGWYDVSKLDIANNLLRDRGSEALCSALRNCTSVTHLNIAANDISPKGMAYLLSAFEEHAGFETLILGSDQCDSNSNRLSGSGRQLQECLRRSVSLQHFDLSGINLSKDFDMLRCIGEGIKRHPALRHLKMSGTGMSGDGAAELFTRLCGNTVLESIDLHGNEIGPGACEVLAAYLVDQCCKLTRLLIFDNPKVERGVVPLFAAAPRSVLAHINFSNTNIDDSMASDIARAVEESVCLHTLNLSHNLLTEMCCVGIARALCTGPSLTCLILSHNKLGEGVCNLAPSLEENPTLQILELESCRIRDQGCIALGVSLVSNTAMHTLRLGNNLISDDGGKGFAALLTKNKELQKVATKGNQIEHTTAMQIRDILNRNKESKTNEEPQRLQKEVVRLHYQRSRLHEANEELRECQQQRQKVAETLEAHEHDFRMSRDDTVKKIKDLRNKICKEKQELDEIQLSDRLKKDELVNYTKKVENEIGTLHVALNDQRARTVVLREEVEAKNKELHDQELAKSEELARIRNEIVIKKEDTALWREKIDSYQKRLTDLQNKVVCQKVQETTQKGQRRSRSYSKTR
eukprot:TRINITY_DN6175_c0_g1_i2.p1 TRINITY_DN6175_c0_g1~~TRINITY_DN6175_c0_g1_i2.p1  ORF type:complete len:641 (+),score=100.86 TRINITY_DN6175_c0_g1_i2:1062-2984(+)